MRILKPPEENDEEEEKVKTEKKIKRRIKKSVKKTNETPAQEEEDEFNVSLAKMEEEIKTKL